MTADLSIKDREKISDLISEVHKSDSYTILELVSGENGILEADRVLSLNDGRVRI
jgi:hypothetical protein